MPGFMPGIHVLKLSRKKDVDGRNKSGMTEVGVAEAAGLFAGCAVFVIASEAKQSRAAQAATARLDCFVALLLAMTDRTQLRRPRAGGDPALKKPNQAFQFAMRCLVFDVS